MTLEVKICGLRTPETLEVALDSGADLVGFVFFPPSPRHLSFEQAGRLGEMVRGRAGKVALTVDADDALLDRIVDVLSPDLLQLHGSETPARATQIKERYGLPIAKVIPVGNAQDVQQAGAFSAVADRIMFDARPPKDASRPGGLGKPFDWSLLANINASRGFILSGGLDPSNVAEALRITRAAGVDVSSGVERAPGEKDPALIRDFIRAARAAETALAPAAARPL
jgi:phosphoribosylanthranilate isomerase